jgi:hypothetical protein
MQLETAAVKTENCSARQLKKKIFSIKVKESQERKLLVHKICETFCLGCFELLKNCYREAKFYVK